MFLISVDSFAEVECELENSLADLAAVCSSPRVPVLALPPDDLLVLSVTVGGLPALPRWFVFMLTLGFGGPRMGTR